MAISSRGYGLYNCPGGAGRTGSQSSTAIKCSARSIFTSVKRTVWLYQSKIENNERVYRDEVHLVDGGLADRRLQRTRVTDYFVVGRGYFFHQIGGRLARGCSIRPLLGLGYRAATPLFWVIRSIWLPPTEMLGDPFDPYECSRDLYATVRPVHLADSQFVDHVS